MADDRLKEIGVRLLHARNHLEERVREARAQGKREYAKGLMRGWEAAATAVDIEWDALGFSETESETEKAADDWLTVGAPREWELFKTQHRAFLRELSRLQAALDVAYSRLPSKERADLAIFLLGRVMGEDFMEIAVLAGNGRGLGSMKVLRSMFERAVTMAYLHTHPEETERFERYDFIQRGKSARRALEDVSEFLTPEVRASLEETVAEEKQYRAEFMVTDCKACGTKRLSNTWGPDLVSMAKKVPRLGRFVHKCYLRPLSFAHATAAALGEHLRPGHLDFEPRRDEASEALRFAHMLLLEMLEVFRERFATPGLEDAERDALEAFKAAWPEDSSNR